jgi:dGTPase
MITISTAKVANRLKATEGALKHLAAKKSHRRQKHRNDPRDVGDPFMHDQKALLCSKAFRRMLAKNQVACADTTSVHLRNRMTHVAEVAGDSMWIANVLGLNVMLTGAISWGHDMGHVPFGHQGEAYLVDAKGHKGLCHEALGVVIAQHIERKGKGLNLTHATLDGMHRHSGDRVSEKMSQEAWVVRFGDKIAYLFADFNDFARLGHTPAPELIKLMNWFGKNQRGRTARTIMALCEESAEAGKVQFSTSEPAIRFDELRKLMYREYHKIVEQDVARKLDPIYNLLVQSELIPPALGISLLTDVEVCQMNAERRLMSVGHLQHTGLGEILKLVPREKLFSIDPNNVDLNW